MPTGKKGMLIQCARCGKTHFLERLKDGVTDGGYTKYEQYQPEPKDWLFDGHFGYLCSDCAAKFRTLITRFFGGSSKLNKAWRDPDWAENYANHTVDELEPGM